MNKYFSLLLAVGFAAEAQMLTIDSEKALRTDWNVGKKVVRETYPRMIGVLAMGGETVLYILNSHLAIQVNEQRIEAIRVGSNTIAHSLESEVMQSGVAVTSVSVGPEITLGMRYKAVAERLQNHLSPADYRVNADYDGLRYEMSFSGSPYGGSEGYTYELFAMIIRPSAKALPLKVEDLPPLAK